MANFRLKIGLNRGRGPVDFKSLSVLTEEINSFLRRLGEDAGIPDSENHWLATRVKDGSLLTDAEPAFEVGGELSSNLDAMLDSIVHGDSLSAQVVGVREQTRLQFAALARKAESTHIPVEFGVYSSPRAKVPKWHSVTTEKAARLTVTISPYVEYMGALHGLIHAWFKESQQPHFQLRDAVSGALVNCYYGTPLYADLVRAFVRKDELIHVAGLFRANRMDKTIESVSVTKIKQSAKFTDEDFESFFGCAPLLTGDVDSVEFVERNRRHDA